MASGYRSYVAFVGEPDEVALELIPPLLARNALVISSGTRLSEVRPELIDAASLVHIEGQSALSDETSRAVVTRHPEKVVDLKQAGEPSMADWRDRPLVPVAYERPAPEHIVLRVDAGEEPATVFVSEGYHPWWRATVDGEAAPVLRAQMAFMAIPVGTGARVVDLRLRRPPVVATADVVSAMSITALAVGTLGWGLARFLGRRSRR